MLGRDITITIPKKRTRESDGLAGFSQLSVSPPRQRLRTRSPKLLGRVVDPSSCQNASSRHGTASREGPWRCGSKQSAPSGSLSVSSEAKCALCRNKCSGPCLACCDEGRPQACGACVGVCGHHCHRHCVEQWLITHSLCPYWYVNYFKLERPSPAS